MLNKSSKPLPHSSSSTVPGSPTCPGSGFNVAGDPRRVVLRYDNSKIVSMDPWGHYARIKLSEIDEIVQRGVITIDGRIVF